MTELHHLSAKKLATMLRAGRIGCLELLNHCIDRIERHDGAINAVVVRDFDRARKRARALDRRRGKDAALPPLFGVPMTIKESYDVAGLPTTWGVPAMKDNIATANALAVDRLQEAGVVLLGKTNVPLMLADWQSYNDIYGTTNNPWDVARSPGGSSGGSAASLAMGYAALEAGSDIGSSIRDPAHFCGLFGHKPTWGLCPPRGHSLAGAVSMTDISVIGPLARSAEDLALALAAMAGPESIEAGLRLDLPPPRTKTLKGLRVAIMAEDPASEVDAEIVGHLHDLARFLRREGAKVSTTARPAFDTGEANRLYLLLLHAAMSGRTSPDRLATCAEIAGRLPQTDTSFQALMARGTLLSHREWIAANERRHRMRHLWAEFFTEWDVMLTPVGASAAIPHDHEGEMADRTISVNGHRVPSCDQLFWAGISGLFHLPTTAAPLGFTKAGLPVGVQIIGAPYADRTTIAVAGMLERGWQGFTAPPGWE